MMLHIYTEYQPQDPDTLRRQRVARLTWAKQRWQERPVTDAELPRMWREEGRAFPFIRDILDFGTRHAADTDIGIFTNADICVSTKCAVLAAAALQSTEAAYCFRRDFQHAFDQPIPDSDIGKGQDYAGSDFYAFRVSWWRKQRDDFPDLIAGLELWDACMRLLIDLTNPDKPTKLRDLIYHQRHGGPTHWEHSQNRYRWKGQDYCLRTGAAWLKKHGVNPGVHGVPAKYFA